MRLKCNTLHDMVLFKVLHFICCDSLKSVTLYVGGGVSFVMLHEWRVLADPISHDFLFFVHSNSPLLYALQSM